MFRSSRLVLLTALLLAPGARLFAVDPPSMTQNLVTWTTTTVAGLPDEDSFGFSVPSAQEIADFSDAVQALVDEDVPAAQTAAALVDYEVVLFHDSGQADELLWGLFPVAGNTDGRGYFFVRPQATVRRDLVLEAPHPINDSRSAVLTAQIFRESRARAFAFAGAHRCSNTGLFSGCSGVTDACADTEQGFLESDMAHTPTSFFHAFHEVTSIETADTITVQVHGFSSDSTDPEFSVSDGTNDDTNVLLHLANGFAAELEARIAAAVAPATPAKDGNSCNRVGDLDLKCGTVNTQGRFTNGSAAVCTANAPAATGGFMHMELSHELRHPGGVLEPQLVIDALNTVIPVRTVTLGGRAWVDLDGDGLQVAGEPGFSGANLELLASGVPVASTVTDAGGFYLLEGLQPGSYQLRAIPPTGYVASPADAGADTLDSDFATGSNTTATLVMGVGELQGNLDAGFEPLGTAGQIGDLAWHDLDGNGLQDGNEPGAPGITALLWTAGGALVATTNTAANGAFLFTGLLPGDYELQFVALGWGITQQVAGFPTLDSDVDVQTGRTGTIALGPDEAELSIDAGFTVDCVNVSPVTFGSVWRTLGAGSTWTNQWNQPAFNDASWVERQGQIGFPISANNTAIADTGAWTYYFRHSFEVADPTMFQDLTLTVFRDDAAVVYLNGVEVMRSNLQTGITITPTTKALASDRAAASVTVAANLLTAGTNVLAVEVHQRTITTTTSTGDIAFDLELAGTVCVPCRVQEIELLPSRDTHLQLEDPDDVHGAETTAWIKGGAGDERHTLFGWDVAALPANASVLHAEIGVQVLSGTVDFYPGYALSRAWTEVGATWNQASASGVWATAGGTGTTDREDEPVALAAPKTTGQGVFPLNAAGRELLEAWADDPASNHGLLFFHTGETDGVQIQTREGANPPTLRVVYVLPTCGP